MKNVILVFSMVFFYSCAANQVSRVADKSNTRQYLTLVEYLQGVPGLQITYIAQEPRITIRGLQSLGGEQEPLYIIDNVQVGNSYLQAANLVDPNDVRSVAVLRDVASTNAYGLRGSNGVIVIRTGKKEKK